MPKNLQEVVLEAMIWMVFIGASLAVREKRYFVVLVILLLMIFVPDVTPRIPKLFVPGLFGPEDT